MCLYYFFALRARASLIVARSWRPYSFEYLPHTRRNCGHSRACEVNLLLRSAKVSLMPGDHYARARTCIFECVLLKTEHLHAPSLQLMPPKPAIDEIEEELDNINKPVDFFICDVEKSVQFQLKSTELEADGRTGFRVNSTGEKRKFRDFAGSVHFVLFCIASGGDFAYWVAGKDSLRNNELFDTDYIHLARERFEEKFAAFKVTLDDLFDIVEKISPA